MFYVTYIKCFISFHLPVIFQIISIFSFLFLTIRPFEIAKYWVFKLLYSCNEYRWYINVTCMYIKNAKCLLISYYSIYSNLLIIVHLFVNIFEPLNAYTFSLRFLISNIEYLIFFILLLNLLNLIIVLYIMSYSYAHIWTMYFS